MRCCNQRGQRREVCSRQDARSEEALAVNAVGTSRLRKFQCQLWCQLPQLRGLKGFIGGSALNLFSKLLIPHVALPGSNPSLSANRDFCRMCRAPGVRFMLADRENQLRETSSPRQPRGEDALGLRSVAFGEDLVIPVRRSGVGGQHVKPATG